MRGAPRACPTGNSARFAATPLSSPGTSARQWRDAHHELLLPQLDLAGCPALVLVAPHPDDETLGMGAMAAQLAASGVKVLVVSVSDGGAARPGTTPLQRMGLESTRRNELHSATAILGVNSVVSLGLPDGALAQHEDQLTDLLADILAGVARGSWCATSWRGDGHPDHEAVGRAAAKACAGTGAQLLEYPIWMWHWAAPHDPAVPWETAHRVPISRWAVERKRLAAQCFCSQFKTGADGSAPVLPEFVLERLLEVGEVVFR
ncbi:LmbE family protein [Mycobacterium sp. 1164966.3]|uniref:PIG-L deacetylase family protein n=1 Tax=Mycobacterium sp. 1164966.3 TaxID=1856861 RepID=UPI0008008274|nr:PIG-L family deacetylase [Mycobacterium sp. 1164966.3]OBA80323.1 LmbE family protein [Mycobacterium sp. 1164966.3]